MYPLLNLRNNVTDVPEVKGIQTFVNYVFLFYYFLAFLNNFITYISIPKEYSFKVVASECYICVFILYIFYIL